MNRTLLAALALLTTSSVGFAGMQSSPGATVYNYSNGGGYASGAVAATHDSSDSNATVYCTVLSSGAGQEMTLCSVTNSSGTTGTCWSFDDDFAATARSLGDAGLMSMYYDATGECTTLYVYSSSIYV